MKREAMTRNAVPIRHADVRCRRPELRTDHPWDKSKARQMMRAINTAGEEIPGISQAILVENGRLLILSGHVPFAPEGATAERGLERQLVQVFENIAATLANAGVGFDAVARLTIYIRDYSQDLLPMIRSVRDRYVNSELPPASALTGVAALFHPDVLVEIDGFAVVP